MKMVDAIDAVVAETKALEALRKTKSKEGEKQALVEFLTNIGYPDVAAALDQRRDKDELKVWGYVDIDTFGSLVIYNKHKIVKARFTAGSQNIRKGDILYILENINEHEKEASHKE